MLARPIRTRLQWLSTCRVPFAPISGAAIRAKPLPSTIAAAFAAAKPKRARKRKPAYRVKPTATGATLRHVASGQRVSRVGDQPTRSFPALSARESAALVAIAAQVQSQANALAALVADWQASATLPAEARNALGVAAPNAYLPRARSIAHGLTGLLSTNLTLHVQTGLPTTTRSLPATIELRGNSAKVRNRPKTFAFTQYRDARP